MNDASRPSSQGQPAASGAGRPPLWARVMLVGGGLLAAWGALVSAGILFVLATRDPGPGGPVPFILGGIVIGFSPILCGGGLFFIALKRLRQEREEGE